MWKVLAGAASAVAIAWAAASALKSYGERQYQAGYDARENMALAEQAAHLRARIAADERQREKTDQLLEAFHDVRDAGRERTAQLKREIPARVDRKTDAEFPLPGELVRVHDAAALDVPAGFLPERPDGAYAPASTVAASGLADAIADNYGACRDTREQLIALQTWVRQQAER